MTDYESVSRVRACMQRRFNDLDQDKVVFWICVAMFFLAMVFQ